MSNNKNCISTHQTHMLNYNFLVTFHFLGQGPKIFQRTICFPGQIMVIFLTDFYPNLEKVSNHIYEEVICRDCRDLFWYFWKMSPLQTKIAIYQKWFQYKPRWYSKARVKDEPPAPLIFYWSHFEVWIIEETLEPFFWQFLILKKWSKGFFKYPYFQMTTVNNLRQWLVASSCWLWLC